MDNDGTYNVELTRLFEMPVEDAWNAWADPEYVRQWWGPTGFTCPLAEIDFREGGTSLVVMRTPAEYGGHDLYNTWTYQKIDPHQRIEFMSHFTDKDSTQLDPADLGMPPGIPNEVPHVITFRELSGKHTEMTVTEYGYTLEEARDLSKLGMEQCLDKMAMIFTRP